MEKDNNQIKIEQKNQFTFSLLNIADSYGKLVEKRLDDTQTRSEYMIYDMMDMVLHLESLMNEAVSGGMHVDYMIEKLTSIKNYVDTTHSYFAAVKEEQESR